MLRAFIESNLGFIKEHPGEIAALLDILYNSHRQDGSGGNWLESSIAMIVGHLRDGQRAGVFGEFDPEVMAITLRQAIDGIHLRLTVDPATDVDAYAQELVRIFDRATGKK